MVPSYTKGRLIVYGGIDGEVTVNPGWKGKETPKMAGCHLRAGRPEKAWKKGVHKLSFVYELMTSFPNQAITKHSFRHFLDPGLGPSLEASLLCRVRHPPPHPQVTHGAPQKEVAEPRPVIVELSGVLGLALAASHPNPPRPVARFPL